MLVASGVDTSAQARDGECVSVEPISVQCAQVVVPDDISDEVAAQSFIGTVTALGLVQEAAVPKVRLHAIQSPNSCYHRWSGYLVLQHAKARSLINEVQVSNSKEQRKSAAGLIKACEGLCRAVTCCRRQPHQHLGARSFSMLPASE